MEEEAQEAGPAEGVAAQDAGNFQLSALLIKRSRQLLQGDARLVPASFDSVIDAAMEEWRQKKVELRLPSDAS